MGIDISKLKLFINSVEKKEGELSIEPGWYKIWDAEEVEELNKSYEIEGNLPGYFGFGSNGGGELFVLNEEMIVFMVPFIGMDPDDLSMVAKSLDEFKSKMM